MELGDLISHLPENCLVPMLEADPHAQVLSVALATQEIGDPRSGVLYLAEPAALPAHVPPGRTFSCVLASAPDTPETLAAASRLADGACNVLRVADGHSATELLARMQDLLAQDADVEARSRRMLDALLANTGLEHLVAEASAALGNPVLVVDPSFRYIAQSGVDPHDETAFGTVMREELAYRSVLESGMRYIRESDIDRRIAEARGPVLVENAHLGLATMVGAVVVRGAWLAHVMLVARERPFAPTDREVFSRLVELVGQELQKGEPHSVGPRRTQAAFLAGLLGDERPSPAVLARRLEVLDLRLRPALYLAVLRRRDRLPIDARGERGLAGQLEPLLAHGLAAAHEGEMAVLLSQDDPAGLGEGAERSLAAVAASNELLVGISNAFRDLAQARRHLLQARSAIDYGSRFTKVLEDTGVYRYCDYTYMEMLALCDDHVDLTSYCHPAVLALLEYDRAHGTELVETLFAYMQNTANTARTARLLNLHKNTLLYRMGRIREIMHNDLASGEDLFLFHLSIRSLLYLGLFEPRTKPRTSAELHADEGRRAPRT